MKKDNDPAVFIFNTGVADSTHMSGENMNVKLAKNSKILIFLTFFLLTVCSCSVDSKMKDNVYQGMFEAGQQYQSDRADTYSLEIGDPAKEQEKSTYQEYKESRQEALKSEGLDNSESE